MAVSLRAEQRGRELGRRRMGGCQEGGVEMLETPVTGSSETGGIDGWICAVVLSP